jgi:hypothetical protein
LELTLIILTDCQRSKTLWIAKKGVLICGRVY